MCTKCVQISVYRVMPYVLRLERRVTVIFLPFFHFEAPVSAIVHVRPRTRSLLDFRALLAHPTPFRQLTNKLRHRNPTYETAIHGIHTNAI